MVWVVGQQSQTSRREKDKLRGKGLKKQCYFLIYFLSWSIIWGCTYQWLSGWGVLLGHNFVRNYISGCELMNEKHFYRGESPGWVMLLAKVLDFQKHWILLAHLLRLCFIFLLCELVCSMENLSSLKSSVQLSKKLEGCEIFRLWIVGYN